MPILKNNLLLLHVAQLKDMLSLEPFLLSCYCFTEFKQKKKKKRHSRSGYWPFSQNWSCLCPFVVVNIAVYSHNYVQNTHVFFSIGSRTCILYHCPITSKESCRPSNVRIQKSENLKALKSCTRKVLETRGWFVLSHHAEPRRERGLWLVFFSIITEANISAANSLKHSVMTSISLLDCTHLYEKFAVWERYHWALAVTSLVCVSEVFLLSIISSMVVVSNNACDELCSVLTWHTQKMMSLQVTWSPQSFRKGCMAWTYEYVDCFTNP